MNFEGKSFGRFLGDVYLPKKEKEKRKISLKFYFICMRSLKLWHLSFNIVGPLMDQNLGPESTIRK